MLKHLELQYGNPQTLHTAPYGCARSAGNRADNRRRRILLTAYPRMLKLQQQQAQGYTV
jgi:hypothetical protein